MKRYTIQELKNEFTKHGYKWSNFHIIGVRSKNNAPNVFDDLVGIVNKDKVYWYQATTNAGTFWLLNPSRPQGCAVLKCGQYIDTYALGLHAGKYKALRQIKPVTVYRDNDKDLLAEEQGILDTGMFGINIHRANEKWQSNLVDKWSAGCQVLANPKDFKDFLNMCEQSKQNFFTYTLLKEF